MKTKNSLAVVVAVQWIHVVHNIFYSLSLKKIDSSSYF